MWRDVPMRVVDLERTRLTLLAARRDYQAVADTESFVIQERLAIMERRLLAIQPS